MANFCLSKHHQHVHFKSGQRFYTVQNNKHIENPQTTRVNGELWIRSIGRLPEKRKQNNLSNHRTAGENDGHPHHSQLR
jgi:hypothetical protein